VTKRLSNRPPSCSSLNFGLAEEEQVIGSADSCPPVRLITSSAAPLSGSTTNPFGHFLADPLSPFKQTRDQHLDMGAICKSAEKVDLPVFDLLVEFNN